MTEEEKDEQRLWGQVLGLIPAPFRGRVELRESAVALREGWAGPTHILASINRRRDGYERDVVIMNRWPLRPIPLELEQAEGIARLLTDAAFEAVLASLPLAVTPPLELDDARENIMWAPAGEEWAALTRFETIVNLKEYMLRITGFKYRVHLAHYLCGAVDCRTGKNGTTVVFDPKRARVRRKGRAVEISGNEPMASVFLGGEYGREGRTVAAADYGVIRDEDLLAPAVSFLAFED
jgi:hypothetical protein